MARTTAEKVKEILDTQLTNEAIDAYIGIASSLVDEVDVSYGETKMTEIERWLTAHLITTTKERSGVDVKIGDAEITYANVFGRGLKSTHYGQMVAMLDTSGTLANLGKKRASIKAIESFE